jgi:hypothetical protein
MTETTLSKKKRAFDSKLQSPTLFNLHVAVYAPGPASSRAVVGSEWPELAHKLPPKKPQG